MLDAQDLKQIGTVVHTEVQKVKGDLQTEIQKTRTDLQTDMKTMREGLVVDIGNLLEQHVLPQFNALPTKEYLDEKLSDLKGDVVAKLRREDEKLNALIALLKKRTILTDDDVQQFKHEFQIFPSL